jgi:hypothetical protein
MRSPQPSKLMIASGIVPCDSEHGKKKHCERLLLEVAIDLEIIAAARKNPYADCENDRAPNLREKYGDIHIVIKLAHT